jgi:hypothetical protein
MHLLPFGFSQRKSNQKSFFSHSEFARGWCPHQSTYFSVGEDTNRGQKSFLSHSEFARGWSPHQSTYYSFGEDTNRGQVFSAIRNLPVDGVLTNPLIIRLVRTPTEDKINMCIRVSLVSIL